MQAKVGKYLQGILVRNHFKNAAQLIKKTASNDYWTGNYL